MTSEQVYIYIQLPGTLNTVPAALLKVDKLPDRTFVGRFRYGDRYLERKDAIAFDPFQLPLGDTVQEFTKLKGIPGAVRDAGPDAWGRRVIEHKLERSPGDLEEIDYPFCPTNLPLFHGSRGIGLQMTCSMRAPFL